jgi:hypothetical protein
LKKSINFRQLFHYRFKNKFRNQEIEITLYLPKGTLLKPDESMKNYDRTDEDYFYGTKMYNV